MPLRRDKLNKPVVPPAAALACLFASGAAGLVAEVCWIRRAALAFGSTIDALSTVLAVFFLGLAIGGYLFGERSPRISRPLRVYVGLEIALAALIVATVPLFDLVESLYAVLYRATGTPGVALHAARGGLVGLVLLAPTLLMGGALPLFCRQFVDSRSYLGGMVGLLYGVNTFGGAVGAALCGFLLLPGLGMRRTLLVAAGLDLFAALLAAAVGWQRSVPSRIPAAAPPARPARVTARSGAARSNANGAAVVALVVFCAGFVSLGNQVLWTRFLALVTPSTVLTYSITLTVVLVGIVIGSGLAAAVADRGWPRARLFGGLQTANGLTALAVMLLPAAVWRAAGDWSAPALLLLLPAVLSGATFPLAVRMVVDDPALAGVGVGRMTALNTVGGIAGSLLIGFVALPRLGLQTSLLLTTGLAVASGGAAWWRLDRAVRPARRAVAALACATAWLALPPLLGTRIPQDLLAAPHELVDYREGREANLAVILRQGALQLEIDRWWQGQDRKTHQVLAAHVPLLLHPAPRRVLIVGVGAGQTPASALTHDIERLDCVEIEPAVFELVRRRFDGGWMNDPRVHLIQDDGRTYLAHGAARYDVIALEVGQISRPGVAAFYTADFYRQARDRMTPNGILSQLVPLPFLNLDSLRGVIATFLEVFPQSVLWYNSAELLLVGVNGDRIGVPVERLELLSSRPAVHDDLRYSPWGGPAQWLNQPHAFLGGFLSGPRALAALAAGAPIERDDRPMLAYASRAARAEDANELRLLDSLRSHLEPLADVLQGTLPAEVLAAAAAQRERNLADLEASALLRRADALRGAHDLGELAGLLDAARRANPDNVQVHRRLGDLAFQQQRAAAAQAHYEAALALDPQDSATQLGLARLLHLTGRVDESLPYYQAGLAQRPNDAEGHNNLAAALFQRGDLDGAERQLEIALRLSPEYPQAQDNLARLRAARR